MAAQSTLRNSNNNDDTSTRVSNNPKHKAPIPLYPEPKSKQENEESEVKLKLKRNPNANNSPTYEKAFKPFDGSTAEEYCKFRVMFDEITAQVPLATVATKFAQMTTILTGTSKSYWDAAVANLPWAQQGGQAGWDNAMEEFANNYASTTARQEQKRFMNRNLAKPKDMTPNAYWNRIQEMNRLLEYLPGVGNRFPPDQLREIVVTTMPAWMENTMIQANFKWESDELTDREVVDYLQRLYGMEKTILGAQSKGKKDGSKTAKKKSQNSKNRKVCNYCTKKRGETWYGHTDAECRTKKRDAKSGNTEEQNMIIEDDDEEVVAAQIQELLNQDIFQKEVSTLYAIMNANTKHPAISHTTTVADLTTTVNACLKQNENSTSDKKIVKTIKVLIDTGCSKTIVKRSVLTDYTFQQNKRTKETVWVTNAGTFKTSNECDVTFTLPLFTSSREIEASVAVDDSNRGPYHMILGRDLQKQLGLDILWSSGQISWDGITVPMENAIDRARDGEELNSMYQEIEEIETEELMQATEILDANYEKADIGKEVDSMTHLTLDQRRQLKVLLFKYETLFDGTLGDWQTDPVDFELQDDAQPYRAKPMPVPHIHVEALKKEINRLVEIGVLRKVHQYSEWASPTFAVPKKNKTIRVVSDLRVLNSKLKRKSYPMPTVQSLLQDLGGFKYATSIDLNMGYWTIRLTARTSKLCTITLPWGNYEYLRLPMGAAPSAFIFQSKMNELMEGIENVLAYLDDVLVSQFSFCLRP